MVLDITTHLHKWLLRGYFAVEKLPSGTSDHYNVAVESVPLGGPGDRQKRIIPSEARRDSSIVTRGLPALGRHMDETVGEVEESEYYIASAMICLNRDKSKVVPCDHPDSAFQLAAAGGRVPIDEARRYGLVDRGHKALEDEYRMQEIRNRRDEQAFKRLQEGFNEHARMLRETPREFPIHAPAWTFGGALAEFVARNRDRELAHGKGTLSLSVRRLDWVQESGSRKVQVRIDGLKVAIAQDGTETLYEIPRAIQATILPISDDRCLAWLVCESGVVEVYYYGEFLPFIGRVYPESGLLEPEMYGTVSFRRPSVNAGRDKLIGELAWSPDGQKLRSTKEVMDAYPEAARTKGLDSDICPDYERVKQIIRQMKPDIG